MDIGADVGRFSSVLRSPDVVVLSLIRAKPRPVRTGLELRINFSLYTCEERLSVQFLKYGKAAGFPLQDERRALENVVKCAPKSKLGQFYSDGGERWTESPALSREHFGR
jgi:hypothetical protein